MIPSVGRAVLGCVLAAVLAPDQFGPGMRSDLIEVVVVADRSRREVEQALQSGNPSGDARVRIVDGPGRGPAWARQRGLESVTGDVVLFLDDDVVPSAGLLAGHCQAHATTTGRVVVGYMPVARECRERSITATIYSNDYEAECEMFASDPARILRGLWGGNVSLRRVDARRVPQVDESHRFRSREDEEFGFRCARAGLVGEFDPTLRADHWFDRRVAGFLRGAADQARAEQYLAERYPDLFVDATVEHRSALVRAIRVAARVRPLAYGMRRATESLARRYGDGTPTRSRIRAVVIARLFVQADAAHCG
ncbi:MAG: glycosyltransferase [Acidimicrobiia bacterium]